MSNKTQTEGAEVQVTARIRFKKNGEYVSAGETLGVPAEAVARLEAAGKITVDGTALASAPPKAPKDTKKRQEAIVAAIPQLDKSEGYTGSGAPVVTALEKIVGWDLSAAERDEAWAAYKQANPDLLNS